MATLPVSLNGCTMETKSWQRANASTHRGSWYSTTHACRVLAAMATAPLLLGLQLDPLLPTKCMQFLQKLLPTLSCVTTTCCRQNKSERREEEVDKKTRLFHFLLFLPLVHSVLVQLFHFLLPPTTRSKKQRPLSPGGQDQMKPSALSDCGYKRTRTAYIRGKKNESVVALRRDKRQKRRERSNLGRQEGLVIDLENGWPRG